VRLELVLVSKSSLIALQLHLHDQQLRMQLVLVETLAIK